MNRRHFLGLLPAIPVAVKAVGSVEPKTEPSSLEIFKAAQARMMEVGTPITTRPADFISFYWAAWGMIPIRLAVPSKKKNRGYMRKMRRQGRC